RIALQPHAPHWGAKQSKWIAYQLYPAHFAITDERAGDFTYAETLARDALGQGFASDSRLFVRANGWTLTGTSSERPTMRLHAASGGDALDLIASSQKPPAIHGIGGISRKGSCASCASHYYSFTRLATHGTLMHGGKRYAVDGISWMDHEYGSDELQPNESGWDWFSIQLDDGREVMLYRLRQKDGSTTPQSSGTLVARNGATTYLPLSAFSISPTSYWTSPHTGARYPASWRIRVRGVSRELELVPTVADQELVDPATTTYWEGAVRIRDAVTHAPLGVGYVELTGYASAVRI
ncbi:MAG TPA: lipocalin family protein, partial [Candidatus Aquilonibacter sp.]|nr:lipocalin family protein [Candidatus Aquilonibacter sp.]